VAVTQGAAAVEPVARGFAEPPAVAAAGVARTVGVAVHVVPGTAAEDRRVRLPPAAERGAVGAPVVAAVQGAAELGEPGTAGGPAPARRVAARTQHVVRGPGMEGVLDRIDRQ